MLLKDSTGSVMAKESVSKLSLKGLSVQGTQEYKFVTEVDMKKTYSSQSLFRMYISSRVALLNIAKLEEALTAAYTGFLKGM